MKTASKLVTGFFALAAPFMAAQANAQTGTNEKGPAPVTPPPGPVYQGSDRSPPVVQNGPYRDRCGNRLHVLGTTPDGRTIVSAPREPQCW